MKSGFIYFKTTCFSAYICLFINVAAAQKTYVVPYDSSYQAHLLQQKYNLRFFPIALATGQLSDYTMEFRLVFENRLAKNNSVQVSAAADIPGPAMIGQAFGSLFTNIPPPAYFGGRATFEFRHYFDLKQPNRLLSPYIGGGVSFNYMKGLLRSDEYINGSGSYPIWDSPPNVAHLIMSNYYLSLGYQIIENRRKHSQNPLLIDIGASAGYRFDYFWRHYPGIGNIEFEKTGLYWWYKTVPVCGAINLSIGGIF